MNFNDSIIRRAAITRMAAFGFATGPMLRAAAAGPAPKSAGWIDAHVHIWTSDIKKYPLAKDVTVDDIKPPSFTAEELQQLASPEGVTRFVLIQHRPHFGYDNSYLLDAAEKYPETLRVVGEIDDQAPNPDRKMRELAKKGVSGFRITLLTRESRWFDRDGINAMWRTGGETGQVIGCLTNSTYLESLSEMSRRYPDTNVVIDHFARIGVDGVIREGDVAALCRLANQSNIYVKLSAFYGLGKKRSPYDDMIPLIKQLFESFGPERLMWGSDSPYQAHGGNSYRDSIQLIRDRIDFISENEKKHLLCKTAKKLFFGDLRA